MTTNQQPMNVTKWGSTVAINNADLDPEARITQLIDGAAGAGLTVEDLEALSGRGRGEPCQTDEERRERAKALLGKVTHDGREYSPDEVPGLLARLTEDAS